jgi:hypothetical protein
LTERVSTKRFVTLISTYKAKIQIDWREAVFVHQFEPPEVLGR